MTNLILSEIHGGVCTFTLNNPSKKNALSLALLTEFENQLEQLQENDKLRALILKGADDYFSVGADLADISGTLADQEIDDHIMRVCNLMQLLPIPCLVAVEGPCVGGAVSILLGCDIMVASENAYFEIPAIKLGLLYNPVSMKQLHARFGSGILTRLFLLGERCTAHTLLQTGMAGEIVKDTKAYQKALNIARNITYTGEAFSATKSLIIALEYGEYELSHWKNFREKNLCSAERIASINKVKKKLGID